MKGRLSSVALMFCLLLSSQMALATDRPVPLPPLPNLSEGVSQEKITAPHAIEPVTEPAFEELSDLPAFDDIAEVEIIPPAILPAFDDDSAADKPAQIADKLPKLPILDNNESSTNEKLSDLFKEAGLPSPKTNKTPYAIYDVAVANDNILPSAAPIATQQNEPTESNDIIIRDNPPTSSQKRVVAINHRVQKHATLITQNNTEITPEYMYKQPNDKANAHLPNARYPSDLEHYLIEGAKKNDINTVRALLNMNVKIDAADEQGNTALMISALYNNAQVQQLLILRGADIKKVNRDGVSALHVALSNKNSTMAEELIYKGASVNQANNTGTTPLMIAALNNDIVGFDLLLKQGADPRIFMPDGASVLHIAAQVGNLEMVTSLLKAGVNPNLQTRDGVNAITVAKISRHTQVEEILRRAANNIQSSKQPVQRAAAENIANPAYAPINQGRVAIKPPQSAPRKRAIVQSQTHTNSNYRQSRTQAQSDYSKQMQMAEILTQPMHRPSNKKKRNTRLSNTQGYITQKDSQAKIAFREEKLRIQNQQDNFAYKEYERNRAQKKRDNLAHLMTQPFNQNVRYIDLTRGEQKVWDERFANWMTVSAKFDKLSAKDKHEWNGRRKQLQSLYAQAMEQKIYSFGQNPQATIKRWDSLEQQFGKTEARVYDVDNQEYSALQQILNQWHEVDKNFYQYTREEKIAGNKLRIQLLGQVLGGDEAGEFTDLFFKLPQQEQDNLRVSMIKWEKFEQEINSNKLGNINPSAGNLEIKTVTANHRLILLRNKKQQLQSNLQELDSYINGFEQGLAAATKDVLPNKPEAIPQLLIGAIE